MIGDEWGWSCEGDMFIIVSNIITVIVIITIIVIITVIVLITVIVIIIIVIIVFNIIIIIIINTRPRPAFGRLGLGRSSGGKTSGVSLCLASRLRRLARP